MATSNENGAPLSVTGKSHEAADDGRLKRDIGLVSLLFTGVGAIIGSGWLFGAMYASQKAGPSSVISWTLGGVMILFIGLVYAELGAMFPVSGGVVRFPHYSFGSFASYTTGWITWLAAASVAPIEVEAALQYATNYIPSLTHVSGGVPVLSVTGYMAATGFMLVFSFVNVVGVKWFARVNNLIVSWKLIVITLVIVVFLVVKFQPEHFTLHGFAPAGTHGVFSAIATAGIVFSFLGFRQAVEMAGETKNPHRNIPIAIIGSVLLTILIYVGLQVAFIGAIPTSSIAHGWATLDFKNNFGPLAGVAGILGLSWLAGILYVDAFISPADTGLIYTTITARISYAMGRNGNAPNSLAAVSESGVPWVSVAVTFVAGLVFFLPFPGWQKLVGFITSASVLSFGSGPLVLMAMRKQLPAQKRPFRLWGGITIPFLAFWSSNLIVYWSGWDTTWKLFVAILLGLVLLAAHELTHKGRTPKLDMKSGFWVIPWLLGLLAISWLGNFPEPSAHAGNLGVITFESAFPITFAFSAFIFWLALKFQLSTDRVEAHLTEKWVSEEATPIASATAIE